MVSGAEAMNNFLFLSFLRVGCAERRLFESDLDSFTPTLSIQGSKKEQKKQEPRHPEGWSRRECIGRRGARTRAGCTNDVLCKCMCVYERKWIFIRSENEKQKTD